MPDLSSNLTALRASGHKVRSYLAVFGGVVVASGTLDAAPSQGATALDWTRTAGSSSDIKPGYRVVVEDGSGHLKLETSVRYSGTISDSSIPIREIATAEFTLSASDVVKVYNTPVLTDKLVEANATFSPDGLSYTNQNTVIAPIANSGGHWAGFVDAGQTYATVATAGGGSFTVDPDSGGTITHLWTLPTGVAFQAGSANTDASPTLEANVGYYVVTHTVTDSSNSATWTQYLLIRVYDASTRPVECVVEAIDGDQDTGWSGRVRVFSGAAISDIPDRSLVAVFVDETINGSAASYGNRITSRSHIKLLGFLRRDENEGDATDDALTFEIISPWARLQEIPGFSKALERYSSTAGWNYVQGLTTKRAIIQILRWYSNWTEFFDLAFNTYTDYDYPAFFIEKATPLAQIQEIADATDARVTGDRTGAMLIHTRPELVALASRSSLTTTITLTDDDRITYRFARDHFKTMEVLECRGYVGATTTSGAVSIFARYPGVPGRGALATAIERLIAGSQTNLNSRCGLRGAAADGVFIDSDGLYHRAVELELELPGSYDVFDPAYQEWIAFTGAAGNRRALDLSDYRFILRGVSVQYTGGTARTTLRLVSETAAPAGQTYAPPPALTSLPDLTLQTPGLTFPNSGIGNLYLNGGTGRIALIGSKGLARTTNWGMGAAVNWDFKAWADFSPSKSSLASNSNVSNGSGVYTAVPDAFSYGTAAVCAWVLFASGGITSPQLYYLDVTNRTWTLKHNSSSYALSWGYDSEGAGMDASFGVQNHVVYTHWARFQNTRVVHTTDNSTFSETTVSGNGDEVWCPPSVFTSSRTAGRVLFTSGSGADYESTDYGATNSAISSPNIAGQSKASASLHCPWDPAVNSAETIFFFGTPSGSSATRRLRRANGSTQTDISPLYNSKYYYTLQPRNGVSSFVGNANRVLLAGRANDNAGHELFLSSNALAASPTWTRLTNSTGYDFGCCAISGDSGSAFYFWDGFKTGDGGVAYSADGGTTIVSQVGNLGSYNIGSVVMLVGW